jgi:hypothetical protein
MNKEYFQGFDNCPLCKRGEHKNAYIESIVRVYQPGVSYHANIRCENCQTLFSIAIDHDEYESLLNYSEIPF